MLYLILFILGCLAGIIAKGKMSNFIDFRLEKPWLVILSFLILTVFQIAGRKLDFLHQYAIVINCFTFGLLLIGFWFNRFYVGIWFVAAGCFLNATVVALNNGKMPVSLELVKRISNGQEMIKNDIRHFVFESSSSIKLPFLADIIYVPGIYGMGMNIMSAGDMFVAIGLFTLAFEIVKGKRAEGIINEKVS